MRQEPDKHCLIKNEVSKNPRLKEKLCASVQHEEAFLMRWFTSKDLKLFDVAQTFEGDECLPLLIFFISSLCLKFSEGIFSL